MKFITTKGYFGSFAVVPRRKKAVAPDGSPVMSESLRLNVVRVGKDKETGRAFGICDTEALSSQQKRAAIAVWGDDYQAELDKAVTLIGESNGLKPIEKGKMPKQVEKDTGPKVYSGTKTAAQTKGAK